jgi:hypothetical protein
MHRVAGKKIALPLQRDFHARACGSRGASARGVAAGART